MSALKNYRYKEEEDGELPPLVRGDEPDFDHILDTCHADGGKYLVSDKKIATANRQMDEDFGAVQRIPVTIITGYLGAGKSTLLEQIAMKGSNKRLAVILNEFGDSSEIEKSISIKNKGEVYEEWLDLGNGCLCCSLKDIGVKAIEDMVARSPGSIDYILLETSGIADPAPIAKMFWQDKGLNSNVYIDGIITVLDSEHITTCLDDVSPTSHWHGEKVVLDDDDGNTTIAHLQIAMADTILVNKADKIEGDEKKRQTLESVVRSINTVAPIHYTKYGDIDLDLILDLKAFESTKLSDTSENSSVFHDPRISTVTISFPFFDTTEQFDLFIKNFLQILLWKEFGADTHSLHEHDDFAVHRTKGLIGIGEEFKVIQGVRDTFEIIPGERVPNVTKSKIVLIGKHLDEAFIRKLLEKSIDMKCS